MASLNSGCNISLRASVHLCKFVTSSEGYQKYSRRLFYILVKRMASCKTILSSEAILRSLTSNPLIVLSSSRDYILRFLRNIHNISGCCAFA